MSTGATDPRGSSWRRWDPHVHSPGTALNDQYEGTDLLEAFVSRLESSTPAIEAAGITDYFGTHCYEEVLKQKVAGRMPGVALLFPNIELRLSIGTKRGVGVNLHLLVSPDDPNHVEEINRFLGRLTFEYAKDTYSCTRKELERLGKAHDPSLTSESQMYEDGANQFKVEYRQLKKEYDDSDWMRRNVLIAVAGGSNDGTSGVKDEGGTFAAQREEIEAFVHIILSSSDQQIRYWLGQGTKDVEEIERIYGSLKPCLHGSDAHELARVGAPDLDRLCWIKGDATFDALKQACLEPDRRVFIGPTPEDVISPEHTINRVATTGLPWLIDQGLELNPGLVAIIGSRGSGKTALADLLAHGAGSTSPMEGEDSFLTRAREFLPHGKVKLSWSSGDTDEVSLKDLPDDGDDPGVHYLSQQFVERLCSPEGLDDELIAEVEKVVFAAHDPGSRLGTTSFRELLDAVTGDQREQRVYLKERLDRISEDVLAQREMKRTFAAKQRRLAQATTERDTAVKERTGIVGTGQKERSEYYTRLQKAINDRQTVIQDLSRTKQGIEHLATETARYENSVFLDLLSDLRSKHAVAGLSDEDWDNFTIRFKGDTTSVIKNRLESVEKEIATKRSGPAGVAVAIGITAEVLATSPLVDLEKAFGQVTKEIGVDKVKERRLKVLNDKIQLLEVEIKKLNEEIERFNGADARLRDLYVERTTRYQEFFELVIAEQRQLATLYEPLEALLSDARESVKKLSLAVVRQVDVDAWADQGEELLDLRKSGAFQGHGTLAKEARTKLLPAWLTGSADEVSVAMADFRGTFDEEIVKQAKVDTGDPEYGQWTLDVGRWLYSTDHISTSYSFEYDGIPLSQLSPGTRGIVLLLLYLALDQDDHRPLIIDQPEENLDPRSVFTELVQLFREARTRRQVVMVTHNANLVVNTDVDQVIVADCQRDASDKPPTFHYVSGGLENAEIRAQVCEILEGGERAFRERARRLRVHY